MHGCHQRAARPRCAAAPSLLMLLSIVDGHASASALPVPREVGDGTSATAILGDGAPLEAHSAQAGDACYRVSGLSAESGGIRFNTDPVPGCPGIGFRGGAAVTVTAVPLPGSSSRGGSAHSQGR